MRKNLFPILTLAIMVAFGACSNEEILQDTNSGTNLGDGRTLTLTASMPDEPTTSTPKEITASTTNEPTTRIGLEQKTDKTIALTWETNDVLQLAFVKGTTKVKSTATVTKISDDGKKASFDIALPDGFDTGEFDLYGVYGAGTIDVSGTNPIVTLPTDVGGATSLTDVQTRKNVMLYFETKDVSATNPQVSATFQHLGSLFSITLKNTCTTSLDNLQEAQLVGVNNTGNVNWAYNATGVAQSYDLAAGEFQNIELAGNQISFKASINSLPAGGETTFWAWYPPLTNKEWPALQLQLKDTSTDLATSANTLPARTAAAGKAFYFYATWDGEALNFANESITEEYTVNVPNVGDLSSLLTPLQKAKIKKLTVTGQINKEDYKVIRNEMPNLAYVDLKDVASYEDEIENKIPKQAFGGDNNPNKTIKTIILPLNITSIGVQAFKACTGLTGNLTIPDKVTVIDHDAFFDCVNLTGSLIIPNSVTRIGSNAFRSCRGFNSLIMSQNIKTIGWGPFYNCSGFKGTVKFPQSLTQIEASGFLGCNNIDVFQFLNAEPIPYESNMLPSGKPVIVPTEVAVTAYTDTWGSSIIPGRHSITAALTGTFTDIRDSNVYKFVTIGTQVWMAENLKFLPSVVGPATYSGTAPYYYVYGYNGTKVADAKATANYKTYGVLYNWLAAMAGSASSLANPSEVKGICPTGWHLPSDAEWTQLTEILGGIDAAGGKLKEVGTIHWKKPNTGATNETGFAALPGGTLSYGPKFDATFYGIGSTGYWWSASQDNTNNAWFRGMYYDESYVYRGHVYKVDGFSVRCVRD